MIKLEHVVLASPEQMRFIIEGMRNPMNSWGKSDSEYETAGYDIVGFDLGENDRSLMQRLANAGTDHRKFMRMSPVYVRITAPLYWWKEFDTYKVGTVANSCSTMHKIQAKEFTMDDFSCEHLDIRTKALLEETIKALNDYRKLYIEYNADDFEISIQLTHYRERLEIVAMVISIKEKRRIKFMHFTVIQIIIMFLIGYICLYTLVDRVMKCIEHCATARAYGRFREAGVMIKMDDVAGGIAKSKEEKDNVEKGLN